MSRPLNAQGHRRARTPTYQSWCSMKSRCLSETNKDYDHYGGRGITVCRRWLEFDNFFADMGKCPPGLTLERKNNNRGYTPSNCRWATRAEQGANTRPARHTRWITMGGITLGISAWARKLGVSRQVLFWRLRRMAVEEALVPYNFRKRK